MSDSFDNPGLMGRAWFKPMVGAWFALLLGGGMWLMPPVIHSAFATGTGLASLGPVFAAPVSSIGAAILSLAFALLGFGIGWAIAERVAAASAPRAFAPGFEVHDESGWQDEVEEEFEQPRRRRVLSAREDLGEDGIAFGDPPADDTVTTTNPEEDFDAVYAEMVPDYDPPTDGETETADPSGADFPDSFVEYEAEFTEVEEAETEFESEGVGQDQSHPIAEEERAFGDMSLEGLLGRLEGALDAHKKMVAESEKAAEEPAPQHIPMTREPALDHDDGGKDDSLAEGSEDDPVIAFLQREASRRMPQPRESDVADTGTDDLTANESPTDAQAALRSALERLGQVNRRD